MKKFLCAVLAICMLCCAGMFVGCKKDKSGDNSNNSYNHGGIEDNDNNKGPLDAWN